MRSPQTPSEAEAPGDGRPRESIARTRAFARGEPSVAEPERTSGAVRAALRQLPPVGQDRSGPHGPGLLASGQLCTIVGELRSGLQEGRQERSSA